MLVWDLVFRWALLHFTLPFEI
uniref:Uncharacterized protein n=1 Tax=Rhizophora mucronata TaxID=61149 RepID=A0A2P2QFD7_RHIMU